MGVHSDIIFRKLLKEINMLLDIRKYLYPRMHEPCYLLKVIGLCDHFLYIGFSQLIKILKVHRLNVFAVHPLKLAVVKYRRRLADMSEIEFFYELLHGHYLLVILGRPAQKRHKVDYRLGKEALL